MRAPFSKRQTEEGRREFAAFREGVPDGLLGTLIEFAVSFFYSREPYMGDIDLDRQAAERFARIMDRRVPPDVDDFARQLSANREHLLDAVDFVLGQMHPENYDNEQAVDTLSAHLREARSVWTIGTDGDGRWEIQHRQPPQLTTMAQSATSPSDRAGDHLSRAWSALTGRKPNPNNACVEAVSAIEAVARPVVAPSNDRATLGTLIRDMRAKPQKWTTRSEADADVEVVISMMEMVWTGHFRHGDESKPIDVTQDGAEMVVQLATVIVHWFRSGLVRNM